MDPIIQEFLDFLEKEPYFDYGDFKREVDLHLVRLSESLRPLSAEQLWQLRRLRELLLWTYRNDEDIESTRTEIRDGVRALTPNP